MSSGVVQPLTDGRPLAAMLLASVLIHAVLLAAWGPSTPPAAPQASALSVRLQAGTTASAQAAAETPQASTAVKTEVAERHAVRTRPAVPAATPREAVRPSAPPAPHIVEVEPATASLPRAGTADAAATPPEARAEAMAASRILADIRLALARHFRYPPLARRLGWEGDVVLGFRLHADGRIDDIRITRPSGHRLLDRSAREALGRVQRVRLAAGLIDGSRVLELPVQYRLTDS
ncbi:energy transducer TonB [Thiohalobacter sp.]|uniref:energy transducer TonB n=1 Tax=Thiohalobacter sp. TaxID=2025948 RepID=UPI00261A8463|nr:energy transducer TonB [Thiohalobacter sp.]